MSQADVDEQLARKEAHGAVGSADLASLYDDRGAFDASAGLYPAAGGSGDAGAILKGDVWTISVAGQLPDGSTVDPGDTVRALIDNPGTTAANWSVETDTPLVRSITGASGTITQADNGKIIRISHTSAHAAAVTGPFLPGFQCLILQIGAGQLAFTGSAGATIRNRQSHTKTQGGQWSEVSLCSGNGTDVVLAGDTGT